MLFAIFTSKTLKTTNQLRSFFVVKCIWFRISKLIYLSTTTLSTRKKIIINSIKREIFIINIDVIVLIKMKSSKVSIQRFVHIRKTFVISSLTKMIVFIHHSFLSTNKNFLFKFVDDINLTLFVHIIDTFIFVVIIRNDEHQIIKNFRNFRLKRINELKYINVL